ncbi:MAG: nickel/cobalt transporter [Salinarimonas sp.]|nr:nickel/cobalt transporter [Salinarimonas sp.]
MPATLTTTESTRAPAAGLPARAAASGWRRVGLRLGLALIAVLAVGGTLNLILYLAIPPAPEPAGAPFGMTARETAPRGNALMDTLLALQGLFYQRIQAAVRALPEGGGAFWTLMGVGFAYGIFHAAGPGHGKAVISAYLVAEERALRRGIGLCFAAAFLQAVVAITMVGAAIAVFSLTATGMDRLTGRVEFASFLAVALLGLWLTWRKAGRFADLLLHRRGTPLADTAGCDHVHLPPPDEFMRLKRWREYAGVVFAAGLRPCAGALVLLVFAASQNLIGAGIAATFAMAAGTAITTSIIALTAVFMKDLALRVAGGRNDRGAVFGSGFELAAAAFVLVIGVALLAGQPGSGAL